MSYCLYLPLAYLYFFLLFFVILRHTLLFVIYINIIIITPFYFIPLCLVCYQPLRFITPRQSVLYDMTPPRLPSRSLRHFIV